MYLKRIVITVLCLCMLITKQDKSANDPITELVDTLKHHSKYFNVQFIDELGDNLKNKTEEVYDDIIDALKWEKFKSMFTPDNFWDLVGYDIYHDEAIIYDYIDYINNTLTEPINLTEYHRETFEFYPKRIQALKSSKEIISQPFYQSDTTDVKFVSLTPDDVSDYSNREVDFESYICVSGFLSQRDNLRESWHAVLDRSGDKPVFGYKWPAEDAYTLFQNIWMGIFSMKLNEITKINIGDVMTFNSVRNIAMESGKLLAHSLILEYPKFLPKVTFVGFSLGTQVIKSCIEELHRLGAKGIVKDVYLLGGASTWAVDDAEIFDVVSGDITHIYTPGDRILDFYEISTGLPPIGQDRLDPKLVFKLHKMGIDVHQVDITNISSGHLQYRSYLDEIFDEINF